MNVARICAAVLCVTACSESNERRAPAHNETAAETQPAATASRPAEAPRGDPALAMEIDTNICESQRHQYAWSSGTDRVTVEGIHDGACKVVVSREREGATSIYDCLVPADAGPIELGRSDGEPFVVTRGRLQCRMMAQANADGTVVDRRDDTTLYDPF